ncbi:ABC transporter substrate-binding protein [Arthrobacter sp. 35W]|uniref:ABC transporter substrate-binding protein n=1 Tax=Arthrobacter sp. 35W TaxID=1132441 RepID=UPI0004185256|nr:extracellular solute-binding protein [Arthrobacter sp. 35W]
MKFSTPMPGRRAVLTSFAAATVVALVGCSTQTGQSAAKGEIGGKITVWTWNAPGSGLKAAIPAFQKLHPGVEVDVQDVGNPAIWEKITTGMAAGGSGLADILNIGIDYMGNYSEKFPKQLVDLRDLGADKLATQFPAGAWKSGQGPKGQVFGVPYEVNAAGFFFRQDLFKEAGIDYSGLKTWDELLAAGTTLKEKTGASLFSMDKAGTVGDSAGLFELLMGLQGAFYFNAAGDITLNGPEAVQSLEIIKKANDLGLVEDVPGSWENLLVTLRGERKVATTSSGGWLAGVIEEEAPDMAGKWSVSLPPAVKTGGLTGAVNGGTYLSIPSSSKNQATAYAFIDFALGTLEGQKLVYDGGGMFPGFKPMLDSDGFVAPNAFFGGEKVNQIFIDELNQDTPAVNYTSDYARALKAYVDVQTRVVLKGADPKTELDEAAKQVAQQTGRKLATN